MGTAEGDTGTWTERGLDLARFVLERASTPKTTAARDTDLNNTMRPILLSPASSDKPNTNPSTPPPKHGSNKKAHT